MKTMFKVEFHLHSDFSPDSSNTIDDILSIARKKHIDRLVITDHNSIQGALMAKEKDAERIIIGEEIMTQDGEIIGSYLTEEIPSGLSAIETIDLLQKQNAFISIPHPFDSHRHGLGFSVLLQVIDKIDAIEVFNARCINHEFNDDALDFAIKNNLQQTVGSDAHTNMEIGNALLELPVFNNADELRKVIGSGKQIVKYSPPWVHVSSTLTKFGKKP